MNGTFADVFAGILTVRGDSISNEAAKEIILD